MVWFLETKGIDIIWWSLIRVWDWNISFHYEDELNFKGILKRASFIIFLYFLWDGYRMYGKWRHEKFLEISKEIINS